MAQQGITIKEAAARLDTTEHYIRQLVKNFRLETRAGEPNPRGLDAEYGTNAAGQPLVLIKPDSLAAYEVRRKTRTTGGGGGGVAADGRRTYKLRLNDTEIAAIQSQFPEAGASIKSANHYNPAKSKAYRHKRAQAQAAERAAAQVPAAA